MASTSMAARRRALDHPRVATPPRRLRPPAPPSNPKPDPDTLPEPIEIPEQGTDSTLDLATWNLLYFGSRSAGPRNEKLQMARVRDVINGTGVDLWGVQEVIGTSAFDTLLTHLPGYDGLLANDSTVTDGSDHYSAGEQEGRNRLQDVDGQDNPREADPDRVRP